MSLISVLGLGFALGMRHATDADHVVAVSTIVARTKRFGTAWLLGVFWGLGHSLTIFAFGAAIILLKITIPPKAGLLMEFLVGCVLVLLGLLNMAGQLTGAGKVTAHEHPHDHLDSGHHHEPGAKPGPHAHPHVHAHSHLHIPPELDGWFERTLREAGAFQLLRSAFVGLVHGLAGSAAVALLALAAINEPRAAIGYLIVFAVGTLAGMLILSALMEFSMAALAQKWKAAERLLSFGTGLLSLLFGLYVLYATGFSHGLFSSHPRWEPR